MTRLNCKAIVIAYKKLYVINSRWPAWTMSAISLRMEGQLHGPPWKGVLELALRAGGSGGKERGQARPAQNKSQDPPPAGSPNVPSGSSLLLNMVAHTYWD